MISRLGKLRRMPLAELRVRAGQWAAARAERLVVAVGAPAWRESASPLQPLVLRTPEGRVLDPGDVEGVLRAPAGHDPHGVRLAAEKLRSGRASLLGYGDLVLGALPDWHREPVGGQRSPRVHWSRVPYLDSTVVGDHKALWEPNRLQYLLPVALAWRLDRRDDDLARIFAHLESWLHENPRGVGVNWASSLEVAYRAISWCWLRRLLADAPWPAALLRRSTVALAHHARHVERHLSLYFSPNTHLTGEALGLCYLGAVLADHPCATRWRARGAAILDAELSRQLYPDGQHFEQALLYHRYTAEIYLHYLRLAESSGWPVPPELRDRLASAFGLLRRTADANGHVPLVGDDDGGLLLPLDSLPPHDVRGALLAGAVALGRPELAVDGLAPLLATALCGEEATLALAKRLGPAPAGGSRLYPSGGLAVLRDGWGAEATVAVLDAGRHGALNGGHAHSDALSLTLAFGRDPLFVDRGTYTYVGPERNEFRDTSAHNTLEIDGTSSVTPLGPFQWGERPARPSARLWTGARLTVLDAIAEGHADTDRPSRHRRTVLHVHGSALLVLDRGERAAARGGTVRWQLAPGLQVEETLPGAWRARTAAGREIAAIVFGAGRRTSARIRDVSPRYGARVPANVLEFDTGPDLAAVTLVIPGAGTAPACPDSGGTDAWEWTDAVGRHRIMVSRDGSGVLAGEGWSVHARAAWWIRGGADSEVLAVVEPSGATGFADGLFDYSGARGARVGALERTAPGWAPLDMTELTTDQA